MKDQNYPQLLTLTFLFTLLTAIGINAQRTESQLTPVGCGDGWDTTFTTNGADGQVNAIVVDGAGNYYIGGDFTSVQGVPAAGLAKWDGTQWTGFGSGIGGEVFAIAISGTDIYVGGSFATAGGTLA